MSCKAVCAFVLASPSVLVLDFMAYKNKNTFTVHHLGIRGNADIRMVPGGTRLYFDRCFWDGRGQENGLSGPFCISLTWLPLRAGFSTGHIMRRVGDWRRIGGSILSLNCCWLKIFLLPKPSEDEVKSSPRWSVMSALMMSTLLLRGGEVWSHSPVKAWRIMGLPIYPGWARHHGAGEVDVMT